MDGSACAPLYLSLYNDKKKRKEWLYIFKIEIMEANIESGTDSYWKTPLTSSHCENVK